MMPGRYVKSRCVGNNSPFNDFTGSMQVHNIFSKEGSRERRAGIRNSGNTGIVHDQI
jgi:hypothetical protein